MILISKVRNTKQNYTLNPFVNEQQTNRAESSSSIILDESLTINRTTPTPTQIGNMRKPALVQLYQSILQQDGSNLTVTVLKERLQAAISVSSMPSSTPNNNTLSPTQADVISPTQADVRLSNGARLVDVGNVLSGIIYVLIEHAVEYVDLTSIMSKYNIDMAIFVDNNNTRIHTYYRARMLHAAILAELLPNGHDAVRQKFASIQLLNTVNTDSYTLLNELRYQLNRIKAEISLTVNTQEYPNYMWIDAFIDRIRCPTYSKTINALENVMVEHARTPLDFNEFMENVINYVQVTTSIGSITAMPSGHTVTQNVIQLAQTKDEVSATCSFCLEVKKTVYPNIKVSHPTEACRRKTWSCPHCSIQMNKPALFHFASDCTKKFAIG